MRGRLVLLWMLGWGLACTGSGPGPAITDAGCPVVSSLSKGDSGACVGEYLGTDGKTIHSEGGEFACGDCDGMLNHPDAAGRIIEIRWKARKAKGRKGMEVVADKVTVIG